MRSSYPERILICSNYYPPNFVGGAELIAHRQASEMLRQGKKILIFAGEHSDRPRYSVRADRHEDVDIIRISLAAEDYDSNYVNFQHQEVDALFEAALEQFRPDVIHFHNLTGLSVGMIQIAKSRNIRTAITLHDHWGFCYRNTIINYRNEVCQDYSRCAECMSAIPDGNSRNIPIRMRRDYLMRRFQGVDAFISPSQYLAKTYVEAGFPIEKMFVLWNGIDLARFAAIQKSYGEGRVRFTYVGHLGAHKGVGLILDAAALLDMRDRIAINIIGRGEEESNLKRQASQLGLTNSTRFWGRVETGRITEVFEETDVLILPSIWPENQPVTITEAMASRTPVIASHSGGVPELVIDGETGFLFESGNAYDLSEKMRTFLDQPWKIAEMGARGFQKLRDKTFENQVKKLFRLYSLNPMSINEEPSLIVCTSPVSTESARALELMEWSDWGNRVQFVMNDWITDEEFSKGRLVWIMGDLTDGCAARRIAQFQIPVLALSSNASAASLPSRTRISRDASSLIDALHTLLLGSKELQPL